MKIISHHLMSYGYNFEEGDVARINLAWLDDIKQAETLIRYLHECRIPVFLDYPRGRTKPPQPKISIHAAIRLANIFRVKYFAVSNIETANEAVEIMEGLEPCVTFVPKIESRLAVLNLESIIKKSGITIAMLDKEDLYTSIKDYRKQELYDESVKKARGICKNKKVHLLELQGVIFT